MGINYYNSSGTTTSTRVKFDDFKLCALHTAYMRRVWHAFVGNASSHVISEHSLVILQYTEPVCQYCAK